MPSELHPDTPVDQVNLLPVKHPSYENLASWAEANGCLSTVQALYLVLGLGTDEPGIANLGTEMEFPESRRILEAWQGIPVVQHLMQFGERMGAFPYRDYYQRLHSGSADQTKKSFNHLKESDFLLAMITNPLTDAAGGDIPGSVTPKIFQYRRMLRLWLVLEALHRLEKQQVAFDTNISRVARKITIGAESGSWPLVDKLLGRASKKFPDGETPNFSDFRAALADVAQQYSTDYSHAEKSFLNGVHAIGLGECSSVENPRYLVNIPDLISVAGRLQALASKPVNEFSWVDDEGHQYELPILDIEESADDSLDGETIFVEVEANESLAEKAISSKSVYLQTAEASHYLPWSLQSPLPSEISLLDQWIERQLNGDELLTQLGGAFCLMASRLGRSLQMIRSLPIASDAQNEWTLNPTFTHLHRHSIRRATSWSPEQNQRGLIEPFTGVLQLDISGVSKILRSAAQRNSFKSLGSLWDRVSGGMAIETWFRQARPEGLERINSTQIFNFLGNEVYEKTGDHQLARLISSHPQSGLPGAVSYASWDIASIEKGLILKPVSSVDPWVHVAGSLLAPIECVLQEKIHSVNARLERTEMHLLQWHNDLTEYVVWALYAATGCRHLVDPFEYLDHFNLDQGFVFINDKNDSGLHAGRITPLPDKAIEIFKGYLAHLEDLSAQVATHHPELSSEIQKLVIGRAKKLPLFFRLDERLDWQSVSASNSESLFSWNLPPNLFRHRCSQQLFKRGVPREVIDGWLGHAERGAATYGDYSPRCWMDDWAQYRDSVNACFEELPFRLPTKKSPPLLLDGRKINKHRVLATRSFGQRLREKKQRRRIKQVTAEADDLIAKLDVAPGEKIQEEKLNLVMKQLLRRETGMAHPYAALRFSRLIRFLETKDQDHQLKICWYAHYHKPEQSLIRSTVSQAINQFDRMDIWVANQMKKKMDSALKKSEQLVLGTVLLAITKRISYRRLLLDVMQGQHYRVIQHQKNFYIEYSETLDPDDFQIPVQRHQINHRIASLLASGQGVKKPYELSNPAPAAIEKISKILTGGELLNLEPLLEKISVTVDQASQVRLPGMVAAALSGRILSTSLPLLDFVRINDGVAKTWPEGMIDHDDGQAPNLNINRLPLSGRPTELDQQKLLQQAQNYRRAMTDMLGQYTPVQAKKFSKSLQKAVREYEGRVSSSLLLLGFWIAQVISGGKKPGKGRRFTPLAANTVKTYFSNLVGPFAGLAYQIDLLELDSDELTELYAEMIEIRRCQGHRLDYFSERLLSFQRWIEKFGVTAPDYAELRIADDSRTVRAGCLTEGDYQLALQRIDAYYSQLGRSEQDRGLMLSWILLLCFRFGLRSQEAAKLRYRDFCQHGGYRWVLVRNNRRRQLKGQASRRAVPLAFTLSEREESVVAGIMDRYQLIAGQESNELLLSELDNGRVVPSDRIPSLASEIIQMLKTVSGNPAMVLHHCRHSFHNRMAAILLNIPGSTPRQLVDDLDSDGIRQLVMGNHSQTSRRTPTALTCLMGHRHPATGMQNYNHLLLEWADFLTPLPVQRVRKIPGVFNTDALADVEIDGVQPRESVYDPPSLMGFLGVLRRVAQGKTFEQAGDLENLNPSTAQLLQEVFIKATAKMRFKKRGENKFLSGADYSEALINYITEKTWRRLLTQAEHADITNADTPGGISINELVSLVGSNRQILMRAAVHCELIRQVLSVFEVAPDQYSIVAYRDNNSATQLLSEHGFDVRTIEQLSQPSKKPFQLDRMGIYQSGQYDNTYYDYAALVLHRNAAGIIRSSNELSVTLLAMGALHLTTQI